MQKLRKKKNIQKINPENSRKESERLEKNQETEMGEKSINIGGKVDTKKVCSQ